MKTSKLKNLTRYIPRSKDDWKFLGLLVVGFLLLAVLFGAPILVGVLKVWALFKYVFS